MLRSGAGLPLEGRRDVRAKENPFKDREVAEPMSIQDIEFAAEIDELRADTFNEVC